MQDVPQAVLRKGLALQDYFDGRRPAVIDAGHCVRLNYETWFFADTGECERFRAEPLKYCGLLTDPVSKERFRPGAGAEHSDHAGVTYYFQCAGNRALFEQDPEMYRLPHWSMGAP